MKKGEVGRKLIQSYEDGAVKIEESIELGLSIIVIDVDKLVEKSNGRKKFECVIEPGVVKTKSEFREFTANNLGS